MAYQADIHYIRFYTDGSAARKLAPVAPVDPKTKTAPRTHRRKRIKIYVDPVALLGIVVSVIMLVSILVGMASFRQAQARTAALERTVADLTVRNAELQQDYREGYDLQAIKVAAEALGMVPESALRHVPIAVSAPGK